MNGDRIQNILYILVAVALTIGLAMLIWLHGYFESSREQSLSDMRTLFTPADAVILPPYDRNIRYGELEQLAGIVRSSLFAENVYVVKVFADGSDHVIVPFHYKITDPDWRATVADWTVLPLVDEDDVLCGRLYIQENKTVINSVRTAIAALGALLFLTLSLLTWRLVSQQSELHGAYGALAEKDSLMIRLERLALAGQLSANILHDIKKPVANIKHSLPEFDELLPQNEEGREAVSNLKDQTTLFFSILKDLGFERFARSQDGEREYVDLNTIIRQAWSLVKYERKHVETLWRLDESDALLILAPPWRLIQVISNLILNACQAMSGRGILVLSAKKEDGMAIVEVIDDGPGVDPAIRQRLFEPFESTKSEDQGTGLGLYIARSIVEGLGGTLELVDAPVGAHFVIRLPLVQGDPTW